MNRSGGSPRKATLTASRCMSVITVAIDTATAANDDSSSGQEKNLSCEPNMLMPCGSGDTSTTTPANRVSTARYSATSRAIRARALYAKRIRLLIASGLIAGITPMSTRRGSPQKTLDFAFSKQAGASAEKLKAAC